MLAFVREWRAGICPVSLRIFRPASFGADRARIQRSTTVSPSDLRRLAFGSAPAARQGGVAVGLGVAPALAAAGGVDARLVRQLGRGRRPLAEA